MIAFVSELMALVALTASIVGSVSPEASLTRAAIAYFIGRFITTFWVGFVEMERGKFSMDVLSVDKENPAQG